MERVTGIAISTGNMQLTKTGMMPLAVTVVLLCILICKELLRECAKMDEPFTSLFAI